MKERSMSFPRVSTITGEDFLSFFFNRERKRNPQSDIKVVTVVQVSFLFAIIWQTQLCKTSELRKWKTLMFL